MGFFSKCRRDGYYVSYGSGSYRPRRYICVREPDDFYTPAPKGRVATTVRQTCASCGKFRSAKWEEAHPLLPGQAATPKLCGRCKRDETSSEEKTPSCCKKSKCCCRKKRHRHHSRHFTDSSDDSYYPIRDRRSPRRYRSDSRGYTGPRASSRDNVRIVIANQPGERVRRPSTESSSGDGIRVLRRTSVVEVPRRAKSRVRARSSTYARYLDDDLDGCVEKLVRPSRRSRSRSLSRASFVEELTPKRSRHRRRSSTSHVQFVDDSDEPIIVSGPAKRVSRRRAVYFDGAASFEPSRDEERGRPCSQSSHHSSQNAEIKSQPAEDGLFTALPSNRAVSPFLHQSSGSGTLPSIHAPLDKTKDHEENMGYVELHKRQIERSRTYSEPQNTSQKVFRHVTFRERADTAPELGGYKRPLSDTADSRSDQVSPTVSQGQNVSDATHQSKVSSKKRRKYRDDSTGDESIRTGYRYVRAPSPPPPSTPDQTDYLTQMLDSSHITPPNEQRVRKQQYGHGPPSPPSSRSMSRSESNPGYRPPYFHNANAEATASTDAAYQYSPTEPAVDGYGNIIDSRSHVNNYDHAEIYKDISDYDRANNYKHTNSFDYPDVSDQANTYDHITDYDRANSYNFANGYDNTKSSDNAKSHNDADDLAHITDYDLANSYQYVPPAGETVTFPTFQPVSSQRSSWREYKWDI